MTRPTRIWVNDRLADRAHYFATRPEAAPEGTLLGLERALEARNGPKWGWTMLVQHGADRVLDLIYEGAEQDPPTVRWPHYTSRMLFRICTRHNYETGIWEIEADELAAVCRIPRSLVSSVLIDLERLGPVNRILKNGQLRGIELTRMIKELPQDKPNGGRRNGTRRAAA